MVINNINPEELLSSHGIEYKVSGDSLKCFCFFHDEKNASFSINKKEGFYHCFSCGAKGSIFNLYELVTGERLKIDNKDYNNYQWNRNFSINKKNERIKNEDIEIKVFGKLLDPLKNSEIRSWLRKYGIESDQYIEDKEIMYTTYAEMCASDLIEDTNIEYTKIVDRIVIPIKDKNRIINYECRTIDINKKPKVLYPRGGLKTVPYNFDNIDINKDVIVVEGIKSLWRLNNVFSNSVAIMGNQALDSQLELLNTIKGNIIMFLDFDAGGIGKYDKKGKFIPGMLQNMDKGLNKEFSVCHSNIEGQDPNDLNYKEIEFLISHAKPYNEVLINNLFTDKKRSW